MKSLSRPAACALLLVATSVATCAAPGGADSAPVANVRPLPPVGESKGVKLVDHTAAAAPASTPAHADLHDARPQPLVTPARLRHGYTIVVVGVNGDNSLSAGLAPGLVEGGYPGAVEVVDWTTGFWPLFVYHLRADQRHRRYAQWIADKIVAYQAQYPGQAVNLVGYSAGAVVAVQALESLPARQQVDRVVLLAGAISPLYDLRTALGRTREGIWNYSQAQDVVALWAGTLLAGTADGQHIVSAGAVGFWTPGGLNDAERQLYRDKLVQMSYKPRMVLSGNLGGHFQCVGHRFVAQWIAPVLMGQSP